MSLCIDEYLDQNIIRLYDDQESLAVKEGVNRLDKVKSSFANILHFTYN